MLGSHARLEDELLLEPLLAASDRPGGPPEAMIQEHEKIRSLLAEVREEEDAARARDLLLHVVRSARSHFEKEERMVVPMAERTLGPERLEKFGAGWLEERGVRAYR